jgi:D-3-phosphoglycerate dehydrogenase
MRGQINRGVAAENINVSAQHLETKGEIGYVVLDIDKSGSSRLFTKLKAIEGTVRARILY